MTLAKEEQYERLEKLANQYFGSLSKLSEMMGRSRQFLHSYRSKAGFGRKVLTELKEKFKINPDYIQYGSGHPILDIDYEYILPGGIPNASEPTPVTGFVSVKDINRQAVERLEKLETDLRKEIAIYKSKIEEANKQLEQTITTKNMLTDLIDKYGADKPVPPNDNDSQ